MTPSLPIVCPKCGQQNAAEARFCGACGASLIAPASTPPVAPPSTQAQRRWPRSSLTLWPIIVAVGLLVVLLPSFGFFGAPFPFLTLILVWPVAGLFLWVAASGRWRPQGVRRVPRVARILLPVPPLLINATAGAFAGLLASCQGEFLCSGASAGIGILFGLGVFAALALVELLAFLLMFGLVFAVLTLARVLVYKRSAK